MAKRKPSPSLTRNRLLIEFLRLNQPEEVAKRAKEEEEANRIRSVILESGLFDERWYHETYPDVAAAGSDALTHYLRHGVTERRNPGPHFNTASYLAQNPQADPAVQNPLHHFITQGDYRNRPELRALTREHVSQTVRAAIAASELFDAKWYLETYPDVRGAGLDPLEHYIRHGANELRRAGPRFDTRFYVQSYRDVATAGVNPLYHFVTIGKAKGRVAVSPLEADNGAARIRLFRGSDLFDGPWYLVQNPDVEKTGMDPVEHYVRFGAREGRYPFDNFMTQFYATQMTEEEQAAYDPLEHYILFGRERGYLTSPQHLKLAPAFPTGPLLDTATPFSPGSIAVMAHIFVPEMCGLMADAMRNLSVPFDLLISTDTAEKKATIEAAFTGFPHMAKLDVRLAPNRGRDMAPMFTVFAQTCLTYDLVLHIHSKRSPYGMEFAGWFDYCMRHLLGSPLYVDSLLRHFAANPQLGVLCPPVFTAVARHMHWAAMRPAANQAMKRFGLPESLLDAFPLTFPSGSMFWFRPAAIRAMFEAGLTVEEFPPEEGQINDTFHHLLERLFFYVAHHYGYGYQTARPAEKYEYFQPRMLAAPTRSVAIPAADAPLVSILMPVYNQWELTAACLHSIASHTDARQTPYEIVLADDGSSDATLEAETHFPGLRRVRTPHNLGFIGNCNNASPHCRGKYILFLNNDTQVQPGWLETLLEIFATRGDAAMVGSKLLYPDGSLQEAGGIVWRTGDAMNYGRGDNPAQPPYCYVKECDYVTGAAFLIEAAFLRARGGLDMAYSPAYYDDTDLSFQARDAGRKVYFQPASIVVHFEGKSHGTDLSKGVKQRTIVNRETFRRKWAKELAATHFTGQQLFRARDRTMDKKIIAVFDFLLPEYDRHAGGRCTYSYMRLLLERGYVLKYFACMIEETRQLSYARHLEQLGVETFHPEVVTMSQNWVSWINENGADVDAFWLNRRSVAAPHIEACRKTGKPIIFFCQDLHALRELREAELTGNAIRAQAVKAHEQSEIDLFRAADVAYTPSSYEAAYLRETHGLDNVIVHPVYFFDKPPSPRLTAPQGEDMLFVGLLRHRPNLDGIGWFLSDIWPDLSRRHPRARLHVVGSGATREIVAHAGPNVLIHGGVDDETLSRLYAQCRLAIIPLRYGAGVKGKLVEAFQQRLPVVSTSTGLEGVAGIDRLLSACDTPELFADAVSSLLTAGDDQWLAAANGLARFGYANFSKDAGWKSLREGLVRIGLET